MHRLEFKKIGRESREAQDIFRLRYQVYCQEWGFEKPEEYPDGIETDDYDKYSSHFLARVFLTKDPIGTARVIYASPKQFPIEKVFDIDCRGGAAEREKIGEISRLAVSREFRQRWLDAIVFGPDRTEHPGFVAVNEDRRHFENDIVAGLYQCIYQESKKTGLTHWYAVMTKGLYFLLLRWGVVFRQIGAEMDYHGLRAPYLGIIAQIEDSVARKSPHLLEKPPGWEEQESMWEIKAGR